VVLRAVGAARVLLLLLAGTDVRCDTQQQWPVVLTNFYIHFLFFILCSWLLPLSMSSIRQ
jgi:hypothetical protein